MIAQPRFLRGKEVKARTGLSHSHIYKLMDAGTFPKCFKLAARAVAWREDEIDAWVAARLKQAQQSGIKRGPGRPRKNPWLAPTAA